MEKKHVNITFTIHTTFYGYTKEDILRQAAKMQKEIETKIGGFVEDAEIGFSSIADLHRGDRCPSD